MTTPIPNTRTVYAFQLEKGDTLLDPDGSYNSTVEDVFSDSYGTWLDTGDTMGYLDSRQEFLIEYYED